MKALRGDLFASLDICGEDCCTEAEDGVVGDPDGVLLVLYGNDGRHRTEELLIVGGHALSNVAQHRGRVERSGTVRNLSSEQQASALFHTRLHLFVKLVPEIFPRLRTDVSILLHRIAHLPCFHELDIAFLENVFLLL